MCVSHTGWFCSLPFLLFNVVSWTVLPVLLFSPAADGSTDHTPPLPGQVEEGQVSPLAEPHQHPHSALHHVWPAMHTDLPNAGTSVSFVGGWPLGCAGTHLPWESASAWKFPFLWKDLNQASVPDAGT